MNTVQEILTAFELEVDDSSELSSSEELSILNRNYMLLATDRPWEELKKGASGNILSDSIGYYITLPTDFMSFAERDDNGGKWKIYVGSQLEEYSVVPFSERRNYRNMSGYAYLDMQNRKIYFSYTPVEFTYEFDYCKIPSELIIATTPTPIVPFFPSSYWHILVHMMARDSYIISLFEKDRAYTKEQELKYQEWFGKLSLYNANLA